MTSAGSIANTPAVWAPLAGVAGVVVCLPLAVCAPLPAAATAHPGTRPVIDLALLVVLAPALLASPHCHPTRLSCHSRRRYRCYR